MLPFPSQFSLFTIYRHRFETSIFSVKHYISSPFEIKIHIKMIYSKCRMIYINISVYTYSFPCIALLLHYRKTCCSLMGADTTAFIRCIAHLPAFFPLPTNLIVIQTHYSPYNWMTFCSFFIDHYLMAGL